MTHVFERIYQTDGEGGLRVVREEGPIHPRCLKTDPEGRPTHILMCSPGAGVRPETDGRISFDIVHTAVPLNPEKFVVREPRTEEERARARANQIPAELDAVMQQDPLLRSVMMKWVLGGYPDLQAALVDAVRLLAEGRADLLAQFSRHVSLNGVGVVRPL